MKKAVIYARYSCDNQTEQSIEGQIHVCQEFAKRNDYIITNTYIDRAMSGTNDNRPSFQAMIKDSAKGRWEAVIVYKLDRFSRNKYEAAIHKHTLKENGVKLVSAMENIPETPEGVILESVIEGMNQYYSMELSQKVKRGIRESRAKGNFSGGYIIYGYYVKDKKLHINKDEADILKYIYEQVALGRYAEAIADELNEKGVTNRGKPFARNTVYRMLENEKYTGIYRYEDEVFTNIYPQIITQELFFKVQEIKKFNKKGKNTVFDQYLVKNKIFCGFCGSLLKGQGGTSHTGKIYHYYKCTGKDAGCCLNIIPQDQMDDLILRIIRKELSMYPIKKQLVGTILAMQDRLYEHDPIIEMLEKEQNAAKSKLRRLLSEFEDGLSGESVNNRIQELELKIKDLGTQIIRETQNKPPKLTENEITEYYTGAIKENAASLVNLILDKVIVYNNNIQIYLISPMASREIDGFHEFEQSEEKTLLSERTKTINETNFTVGLYA